MTHKRKEIRDIFYEALYEKTSAKKNVFKQKFLTFHDDSLFPAISIFADQEEAEEQTSSGYKRNCDVNLVIYTRSSHDEDDLSDGLSQEIELIFAKIRHKNFNIQYHKMKLEGSGDAMSQNFTTVLTYNVSYISNEFLDNEIENSNIDFNINLR